MKNRGLVKYLGIILVGSILLSCGMELWAEEGEKEGEKVEIEVPQDEFGTMKEKYLVTKEERDRIWGMERALMETFNAIEKAYRDKEIDLDTKLMYEIKALEEPQLVPEKYRPAGYGKEKPDLKYHQDELRRVYREVYKEWYKLRFATHKDLRPYLKEQYLDSYTPEEDETHIIQIGYRPANPLVKQAYMKGEIDIDQVFLYQFGPPEEIPAKFIPEPSKGSQRGPRHLMVGTDLSFLPRYSRYLRPETKEKIKLHRWKDLAERRGNRVGIGIDSPKEAVGGYSLGWIMHTRDKHGNKIVDEERRGGLKVYTPTVKIRGKIVTPEMYPEAEAWLVLGPDGGLSFPVEESGQVKEVRKEINLGPATYEKPAFDEKRFKEGFERRTERGEGGKVEVDQFAIDYERGPGKIIRPFEIELELPYYLANVITIGAQNNGGESTSVGLYVTRYDSTDKEPPKVKIKRPKDGAVLGLHDTYEGKGEEIVVFSEATDDKRVLWVEVYANDEFVERTFHTNREHIGYDENGRFIYADYYRLGAPAKIGENKIKVVAYDIGNNSKSDTVKVTYSPEKR